MRHLSFLSFLQGIFLGVMVLFDAAWAIYDDTYQGQLNYVTLVLIMYICRAVYLPGRTVAFQFLSSNRTPGVAAIPDMVQKASGLLPSV